MIDEQRLVQLVGALQEMRSLAVQVRDGAYRKKDLGAVEAELARKSRDASEHLRWVIPPGASGGDLEARAAESRWKLELSRALLNMGPKYSVESIDAALRLATGQGQW